MKKSFLLRFVLCAVCVAACGALTGASAWQDSAWAQTYYRDGARFALEGRLQEAAAAFEQAIVMEPKNGNAYYSLGNVYSELGRWNEAVGVYRRAISLNKADVEAYNGLGVALGRQRLYGQAAEAFERAIELYPKWAEPHFNLSRIYRQMGRETAAQVAYAQAIRLRPDYATQPPRTLLTTATLNTDTAAAAGNERPATGGATTGATRNTVAANRRNNPPRNNAARNNARANNNAPDDTARPGTDATTTTPRTASPPAEARETMRASGVADDSAGDAKSHYETGIRHGQAGRFEQAAASFRRAVALDRNDQESYFALGVAYTELGRWRESIDAFEQAVRLDPQDAEAYERLGRSYAKLRETTPTTTATGDAGNTALGMRAAVGMRGATPDAASPADMAGARERNAPKTSDPAMNAATDSATNPSAETATNAGMQATGENTSQPANTSRTNAASTSAAGFDPSAVYRVGPGDVLEISVRNGLGLTAHTVTAAGLLSYPPLAESLPVAGLTTDEIAARIAEQLQRRAVVSNPQVVVGVREYVSHAIIVSGLVKDSGTKILRREGVPLYVVVAAAQPLPEAGRALVMSHATNRTTVVDLSDPRAMNMLVRPGDVITVQPRARQYFYVGGAVKEPGQKEFHAGLTLAQAVLAAGGVTSPAAIVTVARQGGDGRLSTSRYDLKDIGAGRAPDPAILPGDRIEVAP